MPLELEAAARVALPPKRDNRALDTAPAEPGSTARASLPTPRFQCFAATALAGQTARSADVGSRPMVTPCELAVAAIS
jgi:hypothetical protein